MRRLLVLTILAAGCDFGAPQAKPSGGPDDGFDVYQNGPSKPQALALERLARETGSEWTLEVHPRFGTPVHLAGQTAPVLTDKSQAAFVALDFFARYSDLFLIKDPPRELTFMRAQSDEVGMTHARFLQAQQGIPVWGGGMIVHFDAQGGIRAIGGRYIPNLDQLRVAPSLDRDAALAAAEHDVRGDLPNYDASQLWRQPTPSS